MASSSLSRGAGKVENGGLAKGWGFVKHRYCSPYWSTWVMSDNFKYDVFLSHSAKDKAPVCHLKDRSQPASQVRSMSFDFD
jgi:hypothetical protein